MKRRISRIWITGFALVILLSLSLGTSIAQDTEPPVDPDGLGLPLDVPGPAVVEPAQPVEEAEPVVLEPDAPEAQVANAFAYQGRLKSSGAPVNGNCDFIWDLFAAASGGTSLASDTDANVAVVNGLFTAVVTVPSSVVDGSALYVEIRVRCPAGSGSYTKLSPRQQLYAAPYALGLRLPFAHTITNSGSPIFAVTNSSTSTGSPSFLGSSAGGDGVRGVSTGAGSADNGVYGETNSTSTSEAGVKGVSTSSAAGGYFTSSEGYGVYGSASSATDHGGYFSNAAATSGAALYANGDAKQSLSGDGFVKAAVYLNCADSGSSISRYFNNVNTTAITVINGSSAGRCTVDFGFDVRDNRYVVALAYGGGVARIVTFDPGTTTDRLDFFRFNPDGNGVDGFMMVLVY